MAFLQINRNVGSTSWYEYPRVHATFLFVINRLRDIVREGTYQGLHTKFVTKGLRSGIILFTISQVFFISFFWAFDYSLQLSLLKQMR